MHLKRRRPAVHDTTSRSNESEHHMRKPAPLNQRLLGECVAAELGMTHREAVRAVAAVCDVIARTLAAGHVVRLRNFGTFGLAERPARRYSDPQTGELVQLPERTAVRFRVSSRLAGDVADGAAAVRERRTERTEA